jgi:hypothetical protein
MPRRHMGKWMFRSMYSLPRHKLKVSGQLKAPAALPPGKDPPVLIWQEAGWTPEQVWTTWRGEESSPYRESNSDPSPVQPVVHRYTHCAIPALPFYLWPTLVVSSHSLRSGVFSSSLHNKILVAFLQSTMRAIYAGRLTLLDLIILTASLFAEE